MDLERGIETQRLRLLRILAGLVVLLGFLSVGPVSRGFSGAVCGFVGSVLSRAEAAARYLVIAQARLIVARRGMDWDRSRFSDARARIFVADETDVSLAECRARLSALRAILTNLSRHALRVIRRIEKRMRGADCPDRLSPRPAEPSLAPLCYRQAVGHLPYRAPSRQTGKRIAAVFTSPPRQAGGRCRALVRGLSPDSPHL